jgi:hypothetical protein
MYCPSCGAAVVQGLSYCNFCGAKLNVGKDDALTKSSEVRPDFLVFVMMASFVFGLLAIGVLMGVMKSVLELSGGQIFAALLLPFLLLLLLEGVFIRLLLSGKRGKDKAGHTESLKGHATQELDAPHRRVLGEPVPSVTENTTRALDSVYNERNSK